MLCADGCRTVFVVFSGNIPEQWVFGALFLLPGGVGGHAGALCGAGKQNKFLTKNVQGGG